MIDILFPYDTLGEALEVEVKSPLIDGRPAPAAVRINEEPAYHLYEAGPHWKRTEFPITVTTSAERLAEFEKVHGRAELVVVAHCRPSNCRQTFRPRRSDTDPGLWEGTMELERDNFRDRTELRATLTCEAGGVPYRPVALGSPWTLHFDEPASLRLRGTLTVKWVDFKKPETPSPARDFPDSTHVVAMGGRMPEIWLNSSFDGLEALLRDRKDRRGHEKGLHDMQRLSIARGVWMALVADALAAVRSGDDGEEPDWPEPDWQKEVLRKVLPEVAPGLPEAELLRLAADDWRTQPGSAEFLSRAEAVVGDIIKANSTLRTFVRSYGQGGEA
jgi:hypothetical protein